MLKDQSLPQELNLNTPDNPGYDPAKPMNYLAVAKVGILVFADWLHKSFVAPNTALNAVWKAGMQTLGRSASDTLADVVNDIFGFAGSVMQTMKNAMQQAWDGIKAAGQFIADTVIAAIHATIKQVAIAALFAVFSILAELDGGQAIMVTDGVAIQQNGVSVLTLQFISDANGFNFIVNNDVGLRINSPLRNPQHTFETLGVGDYIKDYDKALVGIWITVMTLVSLSLKVGESAPVDPKMYLAVIALTLGQTIVGIMSDFGIDKKLRAWAIGDQKKFLDRVLLVHLGIGVSLISSVMARAGKPPWIAKDPKRLQNPSNFLQGYVNTFKIGYAIRLVQGAFRSNIINMITNLVLWLVGLFSVAPNIYDLLRDGADNLVTLLFAVLGGFLGLLPTTFLKPAAEKVFSPILIVLGIIHLGMALYVGYIKLKVVMAS